MNIDNLIKSRQFSPGDIVRIVDREENPSEWGRFAVVSPVGSSYSLRPLDLNFCYDHQLLTTSLEIVPDSLISP